MWLIPRSGPSTDTCIMIRILILKKYQVSSIMIHFWYSISISITDTFQMYQYHKSLIHDCDTFTKIQNSLLTRFAISVVNSSSRCPQQSGIQILAMFSTDKSWRWRRFLWLRHNTINWLSSQCCRKGMNLSDTDTELKMLARYRRMRKVFIKFNTTLPSSAPLKKTVFSMAEQIEVPCRRKLSDSMFEKLLLLKANDSLF